MTKALGPQMTVKCVIPHPNDHVVPEAHLTVGALYYIERMEDLIDICPRDNCGSVSVMLRGKELYQSPCCGEMYPLWFCPNHFAPLDDGDTSLVNDEIMTITIKGLGGRPDVKFPLVCEPV